MFVDMTYLNVFKSFQKVEHLWFYKFQIQIV